MKVWMTTLVAVLMLALTGVAEAKVHTAKVPHIRGKIVSVATDGTSIVIKETKKEGGQDVTVTTDANTTVSIDKVSGKKVTDITPGMLVKITPTTGTATSIDAHTRHHKHHKKA